MLDITLRPVKDAVFDPLCALIPTFLPPLFFTFAGFAAGLASCYFATQTELFLALSLWIANRALDCIDGALARRRNQASDLGGFLDLLADFIIYSLVPISCAIGANQAFTDDKSTLSASSTTTSSFWLSLAAVEVSFHINNFVLFFLAAIVEKTRASTGSNAKSNTVKELTSVAMKPALIEGFESGIIFTLMIAFPENIERLNWIMTFLVSFGICQRVFWIVPVLDRARKIPNNKQ